LATRPGKQCRRLATEALLTVHCPKPKPVLKPGLLLTLLLQEMKMNYASGSAEIEIAQARVRAAEALAESLQLSLYNMDRQYHEWIRRNAELQNKIIQVENLLEQRGDYYLCPSCMTIRKKTEVIDGESKEQLDPKAESTEAEHS
jgi:hypothetical protein